MKVITLKEFDDTNWGFSDGTQPISNAQKAIVIDTNNVAVKAVTCCGNCGDYSIVYRKDFFTRDEL